MGVTIYVPTGVPGHPPVTHAAPFAAPPVPGASALNRATYARINFGACLIEVLITVPGKLPRSEPDEKPFTIRVGPGRTVPAVAYSPTGASYGVATVIGKVTVSFQGWDYTEAQLIAIAKTIAPVAAPKG